MPPPEAAPARLFVKPAAGINVREEVAPFSHLPPYGKAVPDDQYWNRRLKSKDVEHTTEAEIAAGFEAAVEAAKAAK